MEDTGVAEPTGFTFSSAHPAPTPLVETATTAGNSDTNDAGTSEMIQIERLDS